MGLFGARISRNAGTREYLSCEIEIENEIEGSARLDRSEMRREPTVCRQIQRSTLVWSTEQTTQYKQCDFRHSCDTNNVLLSSVRTASKYVSMARRNMFLSDVVVLNRMKNVNDFKNFNCYSHAISCKRDEVQKYNFVWNEDLECEPSYDSNRQ